MAVSREVGDGWLQLLGNETPGADLPPKKRP
jgi:hypothetical protein